MVKSLLGWLAAGLFGLALYLAFWPVPIEPQSWNAPAHPGYVGDFAPNQRLANMDNIALGKFHGPEDIVVIDGALLASTQDGVILKIDPGSQSVSVFAQTGGVPLGMEADSAGHLIVADAYKGLLSIAPDGAVTLLTDLVEDSPIAYADDLDIGDNGIIYFSDASEKFGAKANGSTFEASRLEIIEHGKTGRLLSFDPRTQQTDVLSYDLAFANGVAWAGVDESGHGAVFVIETGTYRVLKIYVSGPQKGQPLVLMDNLPGFPDNINRGSDGTFWLGLVSKRSAFLDDNSAKPFLRKLAFRLPRAMQPDAVDYGFVIQIDHDGNVLQTLQDPSGAYPRTTGAIEGPDGYLYITSLTAKTLGRVKYRG